MDHRPTCPRFWYGEPQLPTDAARPCGCLTITLGGHEIPCVFVRLEEDDAREA